MAHITIQTTVMGFRVGVSRLGVLLGTPFSIVDYSKKFEHWEWDRQKDGWVEKGVYFYFDKQQELCYFPKFDLDNFIKFLSTKGVTYTIEPLEGEFGKHANFLMLPHVSYKNDKQKGCVEFLTNPESGDLRGVALQTGAGKAQPLNALIRTPNGWDEMRDMIIGKEIIAADGSTTTVVGVYPQGEKDIYRITFEDGRTAECCDEHLWKVHYVQWKDKWRVLPLKDLINYITINPTYKSRLYVPLPEPEIMDDIQLPLDPYLLGALLGDGSFRNNKVRFSNPDKFVIDEVALLLPENNQLVHLEGVDYKVSRIAPNGKLVSDFRETIRNLGLDETYSHTKFIPDAYLEASPAQKISLLQGLMDTDGTVDQHGSLSYSTSSRTMAIQVQDLVRSLGGLCRIRQKAPFYSHNGERREGKPNYNLSIRVKNPAEMFRLPRKKERCPANYQHKDRLKLRIRSIDYVGKEQAQCIMVDHPDHLYITDNYVVTHNTVSYIWGLQKLHRRSMTTMTSRLEQWVKEMIAYTTLEEDDIYVIQGVASLTRLFNKIDKDIHPKVILASAKTIRNYLEYGPGYQHLPHPSKMCELLQIGIVGTDEYHEHFYTNYLIGLVLNPSLFIPITATFVANGDFVKNVFDQFIPKEVQFVGGDYDKFVSVTAYEYGGGGYQIKPYHYMRAKGYSQVKFEEYLLSKKGRNILDALVEDAFLPIIREHYINIAEDGERFLFLCATKDLCDHLAGVFKRHFNSKTVSVFYSGMPTTTLERFDIILSTPGSAGTGRDIKKLRTCFVFENTSSEIRNLQFIGRLRGPPQMMNRPEYVYLGFGCIPQHQKYSNIRALLYGPRALQMRHRRIR